jgi:transposase
MEKVVGLDMHLKKTKGTIMTVDGTILRKERFDTDKKNLKKFLEEVPPCTRVTLETQGFCWPWIDFIEELGYKPLLANPVKIKSRAEDIKTDDVDSEFLAHLTRTNWLPTVYVPSKELRWLRSLLRHRAFRRKMTTAIKNRTWSEFRKRDVRIEADFGTHVGKELALSTGIYEVNQNIQILETVEKQIKLIELKLRRQYQDVKPVRLLQKIKGIGFLTALTLYAEICDIKRFSSPDKLAHYTGLVPRVRQSGEVTRIGRETKGNKWLKWILIEAAWSHIRFCRNGRLGKIYRNAYERKKDKKKAIKIVARKLVNIIWAVWTYEREFHA